MSTIEQRVETLESVLGQFIVHTDIVLRRLENEIRALKDEMRAFRDETRKESKKRNREWSNLAKKTGTLVEDLIAPSLRPVLEKYFHCNVKMEEQRISKRINGQHYEVDALAVCEDKVFMVEVRSTPRFDDIREMLDKKERFF